MRKSLFLLLLLNGCDASGESAAVAPWEVLFPAPHRAIYLGDGLECTIERNGMLRYGRDRTFNLCIDAVWRPLRINGET